MKIGRKEVGLDQPVYFIADIASNHDGSYERAERLIYLAAEAGADAVKFQNFKADTIVSEYGFKQLGKQSHQEKWPDSVYDTYKKYETPLEWTPKLKEVADNAGVDFMTTPYDPKMLHYLAEYVCAWKIGSGDITYDDLIKQAVAYKDKPIILSTGASDDYDVVRALEWCPDWDNVVLMQCNTNYDNNPNNRRYVNLKALVGWWGGGVVLGLSDHTEGHAAVLGAIALAAKVIEKHFTDDNLRDGPDHAFSMEPVSWRTMVDHTRELELALGDGVKKVEENERETVVMQRRAIRVTHDIAVGEKLALSDLAFLRPCPHDALPPYRAVNLLGAKVKRDVPAGDYIRDSDV